VLLITRHLKQDLEMDGWILGAASWMGFVALESSGYAFTTFLKSNGSISTTFNSDLDPWSSFSFEEWSWTAILSSVLFR
jgi:RsiW-degrading membrane proteinase PrsW (M82 family)